MNLLRTIMTLITLWMVISEGLAQQGSDYRFALLRQDDSVPVQKEGKGVSWYRSLKHPYESEIDQLTLGGSWRGQAESFVNEEFDHQGRQDNIWYLNRLLFHAHLKLGDRFETFAELGS